MPYLLIHRASDFCIVILSFLSRSFKKYKPCGHSEQFKLYNVENGKIVGEQIVDTNGSGHGALAGFLQAAQVDALICGGIGMGAQMALADMGIKLYAGVQGSADSAAKALASGTLEYDPDAHCNHHGHHHGGECGHDSCADHHCRGN